MQCIKLFVVCYEVLFDQCVCCYFEGVEYGKFGIGIDVEVIMLVYEYDGYYYGYQIYWLFLQWFVLQQCDYECWCWLGNGGECGVLFDVYCWVGQQVVKQCVVNSIVQVVCLIYGIVGFDYVCCLLLLGFVCWYW